MSSERVIYQDIVVRSAETPRFLGDSTMTTTYSDSPGTVPTTSAVAYVLIGLSAGLLIGSIAYFAMES
jgi:hypothetical protein